MSPRCFPPEMKTSISICRSGSETAAEHSPRGVEVSLRPALSVRSSLGSVGGRSSLTEVTCQIDMTSCGGECSNFADISQTLPSGHWSRILLPEARLELKEQGMLPLLAP